MKFGIGVVLSLLLGLAGCSTKLSVQHAAAKADTRAGFAYYLPFTQYTVKITRRVVSCDGDIEGAILPEVTTAQVPDGSHVYVLDPAKLASGLKTSDIKLTYHDSGGLKSINASAEDRTAAVVSNVVAALGKIVLLGQAAYTLDEPDKEPQTRPGCNPVVKAELGKIAAKKNELKALNLLIASLTAEVLHLTAKADAMGKNLDDETKVALQRAINLLHDTKRVADATAHSLNLSLDIVSHTSIVRWPLASADLYSSGPYKIPPTVLRTWLVGIDPATVQGKFDVYFRLERVGSYGRKPNDGYEPPSDGLRYRMPAQGRLVVCARALCSSNDGDLVAGTHEGPVSQLGYVFAIPFENGTFQKNQFDATFNEAGMLTSAGYKELTSRGETGTGALKDVVDQIAGVYKTLHPSDLEKLKAETELLKARKARDDAKNALKSSPTGPQEAATKGFEADTALKDAERKNIEAEMALDEARKRLAQGQMQP